MKNFRQQNRPKKSSLVVGPEAVIAALREGKQLDRIYIDGRIHNKQLEEVKTLASTHRVPINYVPAAKLAGFNAGIHDGCVAQIAKVQYHDLQEIVSFVIESGQTPLLLLLDGITDIRNIGGIARTAWCCGVHALVIPDKGVGALNDDAILTSAGALEKIPVCRVNSLMKAVDDLHMNGIKVIGTDMKADKNVFEYDLTEPLAIVMGSEDKGIYPALLKIFDDKLKIPMAAGFESLNVSIATGMILYETMKQRFIAE